MVAHGFHFGQLVPAGEGRVAPGHQFRASTTFEFDEDRQFDRNRTMYSCTRGMVETHLSSFNKSAFDPSCLFS